MFKSLIIIGLVFFNYSLAQSTDNLKNNYFDIEKSNNYPSFSKSMDINNINEFNINNLKRFPNSGYFEGRDKNTFFRPQIATINTNLGIDKYTNTYNELGILMLEIIEKTDNFVVLKTYSLKYYYDLNGYLVNKNVQEIVNNNLIDVESFYYEYDTAYNLVKGLHKKWLNESWINYAQFINTYDERTNLLTITNQTWNNETWDNVDQYTYTYDNSNNKICELFQKWSNSNWLNVSRKTNNYTNNILLEEIIETWNISWKNSTKTVYLFNYNNPNFDVVVHYLGNNNSWSMIKQERYSYNSQQLVSRINYDIMGGGWYIDKEKYFTYNQNNCLLSVETYQPNQFIGYGYYKTQGIDYRYDINSNCINVISYNVYSSSLSLPNFIDLQLPYNNNTNFINCSATYKAEIQYITITKINNEILNPEKFELLQNYPNPFNPSTTIKFAIPTTSSVKLTIYNTIGKEIATLVNGSMEAGNHSVNWNAGDNSSGMYFFKLEAGNFTATKKMMLIK
ncbi:MAG: T9SS type A sorting domain-containing protein [bacterium]